jgi:hypothetical protein
MSLSSLALLGTAVALLAGARALRTAAQTMAAGRLPV